MVFPLPRSTAATHPSMPRRPIRTSHARPLAPPIVFGTFADDYGGAVRIEVTGNRLRIVTLKAGENTGALVFRLHELDHLERAIEISRTPRARLRRVATVTLPGARMEIGAEAGGVSMRIVTPGDRPLSRIRARIRGEEQINALVSAVQCVQRRAVTIVAARKE